VKLTRYTRLATAVVAGALVLTACGGDNNTDSVNAGNDTKALSGAVKADGSSTVAPLTTAAAELFKEEQQGVNVTVGTSGTGGGFEKFCAGETDISDASRPIKDEEKAMCAEKGIEFAAIAVANDALTVVVSKDNDWADCLTTEQLKAIWEPKSKVNSWKDVDPSFPDQKLELFGPGTDSGTFDYFTAEINGEEGASREDYSPSEDDNVIVQGVSGSKGGLGYFGYTYFEENSDTLKALKIDGGKGCVEPSAATARDGSYAPLSRPLFIYPSKAGLAKPQVKAFLDFYLENDADIAEAAQFIPLSDEQKSEAKSTYDAFAG
jgi:phosphate transport system substrate-binding protein